MVGRVALTNKLVAKKLAMDEKKVEGVMKFFYKELAEELGACRYPHLFVRGLGTFTLSLFQIERRIRLLRYYIAFNKKQEAEGVFNPKRDHYVNGMREEIFYLFEMRRKVKASRALIKRLRYGETVDDIKG